METAELIRKLGEAVGVELELDENGMASFEADGMATTVADMPELDAVALTGDIGEPPPERLEALYKALLEAQHLFAGTAGATISIDPETGRFALNRVLPLKILDEETFIKQVETFVNTLETFSKLVGNFRAAAEAAPDGEDGRGDVIFPGTLV